MIIPDSLRPNIAVVIMCQPDRQVSLEWALIFKRLDVIFDSRFFVCIRNKEQVVEDILSHEEDFTHILFLDTRLRCPQTVMADLIVDQLPIMSAIYEPGDQESSCWRITEDNDKEPITEMNTIEKDQSVDMTEMGCVMIDIRVFENIEQPWFLIECSERTLGQDYKFDGDEYFFMIKAKQHGYVPYINIMCRCEMIDDD